jgi:hypothetical protein
MELSEIISLYNDLNTHLSPVRDSDTDAVAAINRAYNRIAKYIRYFDPKITWTLTSADGYTMSRTTIFSKAVRVPYEVFFDSSKLPLYTLNEFVKRYTDYRWNATAGTPYVSYWQAGKLYLHVPPDATAQTKTCYVSGECYPIQFSASSTTDVPDMPLELHETIAYLASVYAGEPTASDEVALMKLGGYSKQALADLNQVRDMNESLILGEFDASHEKYIC